jgi:hypothetical protein
LPSSLLMVAVSATMIAFFNCKLSYSGSNSSQIKPSVWRDVSLILGSAWLAFVHRF